MKKQIYELKYEEINSLICAFQGFRLKNKFLNIIFPENVSMTAFTRSKVKL